MIPSDCTKQVTLTFKRAELLDDIAAYGYVEGDILSDDSGQVKVQTQDVIQDSNRELCCRIIQLVLAKCREKLYPFTKDAVLDTNTYDDTLADPTTYTITLMVPETFSKTTADFLCKLIHQLIVARVLENWLKVTNPSKAAMWMANGDNLEEQLESAKSIRIRRVRRKLSPF